MNISYLNPLSLAWNRMKISLFRPFNLNKWFAIGFTSFLAGLLDWDEFGSGFNDSDNGRDHVNWDEIINFPNYAWDWIDSHPDYVAMIIFVALVIIGLILLLTWLSSRGKFMFLENVITDSYKIKAPWREYKNEVLFFLWRLGYGIVLSFTFIGYFSWCYVHLYDMYQNYASDSEMLFTLLKMGIFALVLMLVTGFISLLVNDFVVPLMYKNRCKVWIGFSRFLPLFNKYIFKFIVYAVFVVFIYIVIGIVIVFAGLFTCCVGFLILMIPYIGSVILLPVSFTFRAFSLEFLEQFGEQYQIFPGEQPAIEGSESTE